MLPDLFFVKEGKFMKVCHVCKAQCEDFAELCPICGADLSEYEENSAVAVERSVEQPVLLASMEDVVSAEILKDILSSNGIPYSSGEAEDEGSMRVVFGGGFVADDIYVDAADFEAAEKLYNEFLESEPEFSEEDFFIEEEFEEE